MFRLTGGDLILKARRAKSAATCECIRRACSRPTRPERDDLSSVFHLPVGRHALGVTNLIVDIARAHHRQTNESLGDAVNENRAIVNRHGPYLMASSTSPMERTVRAQPCCRARVSISKLGICSPSTG